MLLEFYRRDDVFVRIQFVQPGDVGVYQVSINRNNGWFEHGRTSNEAQLKSVLIDLLPRFLKSTHEIANRRLVPQPAMTP